MRKLDFRISCLLILSMLMFPGASSEENIMDSESDSEGFSLSGDVEWVVTSSPGGGSSIFTQNIVDIIKMKGLLGKHSITINYRTDGGGAIGRRSVSTSSGRQILTFNSGDLLPFVTVEKSDLDRVRPLAVMATDTQVFLVRSDYETTDMKEIIATVQKGKRLIVGGSKGDDESVYMSLKNAIDKQDAMAYIRSDSTAEALTQILGKHIDIVIAKPAASFDYVSSGELVPVASMGQSRLKGVFDAPTMKELGYPDVKFEIFRGIVGPENMSAEEVKFWDNVFSQVAGSSEWKSNYINKFYLNPNYKSAEESSMYMQGFEDSFLSQ